MARDEGEDETFLYMTAVFAVTHFIQGYYVVQIRSNINWETLVIVVTHRASGFSSIIMIPYHIINLKVFCLQNLNVYSYNSVTYLSIEVFAWTI